MNLNNYTIKSQEAIQQAVQLTTLTSQQAVEPAHILKAILEVDENVTPFILKKLNVNPATFGKMVAPNFFFSNEADMPKNTLRQFKSFALLIT